jgi:hypothetical protein
MVGLLTLLGLLTMTTTSKRLSKIGSFKTVHQAVLVFDVNLRHNTVKFVTAYLGVSSSTGTSTVQMTLFCVVTFGIIVNSQVIGTAGAVTRGLGHGDGSIIERIVRKSKRGWEDGTSN